MFCPKCGQELAERTAFCEHCGADLNAAAKASSQPVYEATPTGSPVQSRSIALCIVLSILTCGIYGIYWFVVLTDETNHITNQTEATSGGLAFLFSIITCGIYYFYWSYKMGEKVDMIKGTPNGSSSILFLILSIFGLGFVNYIIAQDAINNFVASCQ